MIAWRCRYHLYREHHGPVISFVLATDDLYLFGSAFLLGMVIGWFLS